MLIILEGVDCSGKTTLAKRLFERMPDGDLLHRGPPQSDDMRVEYLEPLMDYQPMSGRDIVCDRWHVGELVYGPMYRGESKLSTDNRTLVEIERTLHAKGALIVYCRPPLEVITKRLEGRGDDYINEGDHVRLYAAYDAVMPRPVCTVTLNTTATTLSRLDQVRGCARFLETCAMEVAL